MVSIPLPVIANTYRCAISWSGVASPGTAVNVIHLKDVAGTANASACYNTLNASVTSSMWAQTLTTVAADTVKITPLDGSSATLTFSTGRPSKWGGLFGSGEIEPAVSALVSLYTSQRGRSFRGRVFLPFVAEGVSAQGQVASSTLSTLQSGWTAFLGALTSNAVPFELVVARYDRKHSGASPGAQIVTTASVQTFLATQRRRQSRLRFP